MTDNLNTQQAGLPPLPSPEILLPWRMNASDGSVHSAAYTADQMREYARAALGQQPAQAEPVVPEGWKDAAEWLRNNYQDYPTIDALAAAMIAAAPQVPDQAGKAVSLCTYPKCDCDGPEHACDGDRPAAVGATGQEGGGV